MLESNTIEGEYRLNPGDEAAFGFSCLGLDTEENILNIHEILTRHLKVKWSGKYRTCNVCVGNYVAPQWKDVPKLMKGYTYKLLNYNSWEAHNEFQKIHPFQDFNGRVGRLIWLSKAIHEGYFVEIPFLQKYYYQTLERYHKDGG